MSYITADPNFRFLAWFLQISEQGTILLPNHPKQDPKIGWKILYSTKQHSWASNIVWQYPNYYFCLFFLSEVSFTDTDDSLDSRKKERLPLLLSTISTCSRTFRHLFASLSLIAVHGITRLFIDEIYHL